MTKTAVRATCASVGRPFRWSSPVRPAAPPSRPCRGT